jgi:hypothetical protein
MQHHYRKMIVIGSILIAVGAGASWAGPPNPTVSDANGNTAGGTAALANTEAGPSGGFNNTAFGSQALTSNLTGDNNTASGASALAFNTTGSNNTANGVSALEANTTGNNNTASGASALAANTTGSNNTASGASALAANTTGVNNTAAGVSALEANTTGSNNAASGVSALAANTTGINNTATGVSALAANTTGNNNTANGVSALETNSIGGTNTAVGASALRFNTTGVNNTAAGAIALHSNDTGANNTAIGREALFANLSGNNNITLGYKAGFNTTGSNNIAIGNQGVAGESSTIRIGTSQARTFLAGIHGKTVGGGSMVLSNSSGQLGTVVSSARYKQDIADMGAQSAKLQQLRPVTFHYAADSQGATQYGLIAEEVAKVYPELVVYGEQGQIESVQYHQLISLLLNEIQQHPSQMKAQVEQLTHQSHELEELKTENARLRTAIGQMKNVAARLAQFEAAQVARVARR